LTFFLECTIFFHFFPNKNCQVRKIETKNHVGCWGGGERGGGNPTILTQNFTKLLFFYF
jgi:hypothetical protein